MLPHLIIQEIKQHRLLIGKTPESAIIKTLDREQKFKNVCCITSDSIFTKFSKDIFYVKGLCKASMQKVKCAVARKLSPLTSKVIDGSCSCPAGKGEYCNVVCYWNQLTFHRVNFNLPQKKILQKVCTSRPCQ